MKRDRLIKRLRQLYTLELINAFFLPIVFTMFGNKINEKIGVNAIMAMALNGIVLLEGSSFWFVITRQLTTKHKSNFIGAFEMFKKLNIVLIGVTLLTITINPFVGPFDKIGTGIFILLAILEHINYFETQLMYDNRNDLKYLIRYRRLKKAKLRGYLDHC